MARKIVLNFTSTAGNKISLAMNDPKDSLTWDTVRTAMEKIIKADVFQKSDGESLAAVKGASIVVTYGDGADIRQKLVESMKL